MAGSSPGLPGVRIGPRIGSGFTQRFLPWQERGYKAGIEHALGQLPSAAGGQQTFEETLKTVGGTPTEFTNIPQSAYLTPETLGLMTNTLFADSAARTQNQQNQIREGGIPGATTRFGLTEQLAAPQRFNDALAQREATTLEGQYSPTINRLAAEAQTNVEAQRAGDDRNRRALALASRRDLLSRENSLLQALAAFGQPLGYDPGRQHVAAYPFG